MNDNSVYIISEIGINHNGSIRNCFKLVDAAAAAGCDCVKFQFFSAYNLYPRSAGRLDWQDKHAKYSYDIYRAVQSFELPGAWINKIMQYCKIKKIDFLASVFDIKGANYLVERGMHMIKLSSYSITNLPLIKHCAAYKLPIIISTGGATLAEVKDALKTINRYHNKVSLLHCSIKYPTKLKDCNLGVIRTLQRVYPDNKIGYSDHTKEVFKAPVQAVYLGARIIEKHITLDKNMPGPDHFFALQPQELKQMVSAIRKAEDDAANEKFRIDKKLYGSGKKQVFKQERYLRDFCFATIFANKNIKKGKRIRYKDLVILRPGKKKRGLEPKFIDLFKKRKIYSSSDIAREEAIDWAKISNAEDFI